MESRRLLWASLEALQRFLRKKSPQPLLQRRVLCPSIHGILLQAEPEQSRLDGNDANGRRVVSLCLAQVHYGPLSINWGLTLR